MNREEAKEFLPIIQAFVKGKIIQYNDIGEWRDMDAPNWMDDPSHYRIKPELKYRPFKTQEECWNEMHKHPDFGWVKRAQEPAYLNLNKIEEIGRVDGWNFSDVFKNITFTDGEPFGVKEE